MTVIDHIKSVKAKVQHYLEQFPHLRDSDSKLVATYWKDEIGHNKVTAITGYQLLKMYAEGELTAADNITRYRRKLQEQHPELRGETYGKRKDEADDVAAEIVKM